MPEVSEIVLTCQYLKSKLKNKIIEKIEILNDKYTRKSFNYIDIIETKYIIKNIDSKGKLMWFKLCYDNSNEYSNECSNDLYFMSHMGLTGMWSFNETKNSRIKIKLNNTNTNTYLYFNDARNFGKIEILNQKEYIQKTNLLADDVLKTAFTEQDFINIIEQFLNKSKKRYDQLIFKVLLEQNKKTGLFSGLGNYLTAEILYDAKISPYRTIGSLSKHDLITLSKSIKYITKLSYYNNNTGYMNNFGSKYIKQHKLKIDENKLPEYHNDIKIKKNDEFKFKVYGQKFDPNNNEVIADKKLNKGRTTYWVKNIQK